MYEAPAMELLKTISDIQLDIEYSIWISRDAYYKTILKAFSGNQTPPVVLTNIMASYNELSDADKSATVVFLNTTINTIQNVLLLINNEKNSRIGQRITEAKSIFDQAYPKTIG